MSWHTRKDLEERVQRLEEQLASRRNFQYYGYEYKSSLTLWGWPLVHIAQGANPETGRPRVAKGIIAIGNIAIGVVALGGLAVGVVALGGMALGLLSFAGISVGVVIAVGGLAVGSVALGGLACGVIACGGLAIGYYAVGGETLSVYSLAALTSNPDLPDWARSLLQSLQDVGR